MDYAPVIVFAYKRKDKLEQCIYALEQNMGAEKTDLFVFSDGAKGKDDREKVQQVREYLDQCILNSRFKKAVVYKSEVNKGLAHSIIDGVSQIIGVYGKAIIVEDDIITSSGFLSYMNEGLAYYADLKTYGSISAYTSELPGLEKYNKDIYVTRKGECWGWATWKDRWDKVDWQVGDFGSYLKNRKERRNFESLQAGIDNMLISQMNGEIDSWAVRWCYHLFKNELLTVYPKYSRVKNIGFDGSGTHGLSEMKVNRIENSYGNKCKFEALPVNRRLEKENAVITKRAFIVKVFDKIVYIIKNMVESGKAK